MSEFKVPVLEHDSEPHPNADSLELAKIGGWRCVTHIGTFESGQKVGYISEASVVLDNLIAVLGLEGRLSGSQKNRVKAVKLRGSASQGLVVYGRIV